MPQLLFSMCFCKIEKLHYDEELVVPNRPRQQTSRLSPSSQSVTGHNLSSLPPRLEPFGAVQSYSRPRTVELRASVSQERVVVVETITPCPYDSMFRQRPYSFAQGPLSKDLQRGARPLSIADSNSQLGLDLIRAKNPRQSNGMVAVITPRQSGSVVCPLIPSGRQSSASYYSPRQSATRVRPACYPSQRERTADFDEENSASRSSSHRGDEPRR